MQNQTQVKLFSDCVLDKDAELYSTVGQPLHVFTPFGKPMKISGIGYTKLSVHKFQFSSRSVFSSLLSSARRQRINKCRYKEKLTNDLNDQLHETLCIIF